MQSLQVGVTYTLTLTLTSTHMGGMGIRVNICISLRPISDVLMFRYISF